jgi:polysaccharide biosynthesis protein PslG
MTGKLKRGHFGLHLALLLIITLITILGPAQAGGAQGLGSDPRFGAVQAIDAPHKGAEAGVRWERIIFPWAMMQPTGPDEMLPTYYSDERIQAQARGGVTEVGVIVYTPAWAAIDPGKGWGAVPRGLDLPATDERNVFARFVNRLAAKYRGTVDHWIIWNEPDLVNLETRVSGNWAGTEHELWQLQKSAYLGIKQANPQATVLLTGFSYWHSKELGRPQYLKRLLDVGAGDSSAPGSNWYFDGITAHAYGNPFNSFALPEMYRRILAERGLERKPVWITEANVIPWDDPIGLIPREPWRATMDEQSSFIVQSFALALAANVERMTVYKLTDEAAEDGQYFGLVRSDGSTRPAFKALQTAISAFSGVTSARLTWDGSADPLSSTDVNRLIDSLQPRWQFVCPCSVAQVAMERPGQRITVLWNTGPTPVSAVVQAAGAEATVLTPDGGVSTVQAQGDELRIYLSGARSDTEPRDAGVRLVGGRPVILVEELTAAARPSRPPRVEAVTRYAGFSVANAQFQEYLAQNGGIETVGQPVSREFDLLGSPTQIFQRRILQLGEDGSVRTLSLDQLRISPGGEQNIGELVRSVLIGQGLSSSQENSLRDSPALRQYDPSQSHGLRSTAALPRSNLKYAFEPE